MTIQQWPVSTKAAVQIEAMEQMVGATLDDVRKIDNNCGDEHCVAHSQL